MQNNFIIKISPNVRMIIFTLLILSLLLAESIYLILFITTLTLILLILTDKKVNLCVKILKKIINLLLIFLIIYIIILKEYDISIVGILLYKLVIIIFLFEIFIFNTDFNGLHNSLYVFFKPLRLFKVDIENFSFNVTLALYFFCFLSESQLKIKNAQIFRGKRSLNIRNFIFPCILYSINKLNELQDNLKIKFYKLNNKKTDLKSMIMLVASLVLFIICLYKEVVL